jgi:hypothetical protein
MIDSVNIEERLQGLIGIECHSCLDTGIVQEWRDGIGWCMVYEIDPIKDGEGKTVRRMKQCHHGGQSTEF